MPPSAADDTIPAPAPACGRCYACCTPSLGRACGTCGFCDGRRCKVPHETTCVRDCPECDGYKTVYGGEDDEGEFMSNCRTCGGEGWIFKSRA
jgi:hypothetical protein